MVRKGGHRNLLHAGWNSAVGQKFQPKVLAVLQGKALCGKEAFCWTRVLLLLPSKVMGHCAQEQTDVNYSISKTYVPTHNILKNLSF